MNLNQAKKVPAMSVFTKICSENYANFTPINSNHLFKNNLIRHNKSLRI